ncbi:S-adenosyl-L-methionine-dependent methyltransferase [Aspergillus ambiguus]|uniref:S-adenosyl-L-methionine-dependent methyltransferase n=1 Tax=Aspergillus ambiguus TaxID=176160 RepID=UPI003CCD80B9
MHTPSASPRVLSLIEDIKQSALQKHHTSHTGDSHFRLLALIDELKLAVETPTETILRLIYQPPQNAALRTVIDLGVFPLLVQHHKRGLSATQLAAHTGADRELIVRLMRVVTALGLCNSDECELYRPNEKTEALTQPIGRDGVPCIYDMTLPTLAKLPEYFREHQYVMPKDYSKSPMHWAVGQSQFEWLGQRKHRQALFNSYMSSRREGKPNWFDVYPVSRLIGHANFLSSDDAFLVDIGGNQGHDLVKFRTKYPHMPARLILQDLPAVLESKPPTEGIETMGYSFLDPQPVKGAMIYYFRAIFHDWPDHVCHRILLNTVSAMDPHRSRVLIVDFVLPDTNTPLLQASLDVQMMSIGAGVERSERQWRDLLHGAGLEIQTIWRGSPGMESVIEAVLKQ